MGQAKKIPWYSHRLTHRKRVTSELHDRYFRLMTIKHAISKIEWAIEPTLNYYITQLSSSPSGSCCRVEDSYRRDVVRKATPGRRGPREALMSWGPEKMLIRCSKGSHHPAEWASGPPVELQENKQDTTPAPSHTQTLSNPFRTLTIKWEVNILLKRSSCVCLFIASVCILHESIYMYITILDKEKYLC